jgi:HD-GYP domain-containing protein (c-di-GMP phosphodiesterase class II)
VADRSGTPDTSLWSAFSTADSGSIVCLSQVGADTPAGADNANEASNLAAYPLRRAWWMKHLSLLAVLQAACLVVGLGIHQQLQNAADASQIAASTIGGLSSPVLTAFIWIASVQGALGYLVFSRVYRACREQQEQSQASVEQHQQALARTRNAVILGLSRLAEPRDGDTQGHLDRVGIYAEKIARTASQRPEFAGQISSGLIERIRPSAALHDIGKVGIEDAILQKPGRLTDDERRRMQAHTRISGECLLQIQQCLGDSNFLTLAHEIAVFHHERWDGSGYPSKLTGEAIPLSARIVAIADVYDALSARRVYKDAYAHERCVEIIAAESGKHFDPRLVDVFMEVESEFAQIATSCSDSSSDIFLDSDTSLDFGDDDTLAEDDLSELDTVLGDVDVRLEASAG